MEILNISPETYSLFLLPILIFIARILDVSIGTIRIIAVSRGRKVLAPVLGFFEILIWITAMGQIMQNLNSPVNYLAYAGGFATGNYVGMIMEEKLAMGVLMIRVVTKKGADELIQHLREEDFGVTHLNAIGATGVVNIIYTVIDRKDVNNVIKTILKFNPSAFYTVEEIKQVKKGIFPNHQSYRGFGTYRKSK